MIVTFFAMMYYILSLKTDNHCIHWGNWFTNSILGEKVKRYTTNSH